MDSSGSSWNTLHVYLADQANPTRQSGGQWSSWQEDSTDGRVLWRWKSDGSACVVEIKTKDGSRYMARPGISFFSSLAAMESWVEAGGPVSDPRVHDLILDNDIATGPEPNDIKVNAATARFVCGVVADISMNRWRNAY
jgi:hypothetical protein